VTIEFGEAVKNLGHTFMELISEGMGIKKTHLKEMDCAEEVFLLSHYYPPCPEPELAVGINKHADNDILTILLQDEIGGLQVLHNDLWYDVPHIPGALVINTGDLLQASIPILMELTTPANLVLYLLRLYFLKHDENDD